MANRKMLTPVAPESAIQQIGSWVKRDSDLKRLVADLRKQCEYFLDDGKVLMCRGPAGIADAQGKLATLRDACTKEVIVQSHCRRHLEASALAVHWAVHGAQDAQ